jgi:uncharacterized protein YcfJ
VSQSHPGRTFSLMSKKKEERVVGATVGGAAGGLVGALLGGPLGALIGAGISAWAGHWVEGEMKMSGHQKGSRTARWLVTNH